MSLLSRNTGGSRRSVARMATVFVGTLLMYLVVTAIPAIAVSTCDTFDTPGVANGAGTGSDELRVTLGADDKVVIQNVAGTYNFSQNGGAFVACSATAGAATAANVGWISVTGSDAGAETFTVFDPDSAVEQNETNITVDLKNGTDTLILEFGALASPATVDPAPGIGGAVELGTSAGGIGVADVDDDDGVRATLKFTNAEVVTINGDNTASDFLDASGQSAILQNSAIDPFGTGVTGDDVPGTAAGSPFTQNLNLNGFGGDDTLFSGAGNDNFQGGPGADTVNYVGAASGVVVDLTAATGTGMGTDTLADVQNATGSGFADTITGNSLNNVLSGGAGNDTLDGLAGDDTVNGNAGDDTLNEGAAANGADTLSGGSGGPEVDGDTLNYGARTTSIIMAPGGGAVSGADANADGDASDAGDEKDTIQIDIENYVSGTGNDKFVGSGNDEFVTPGAGNDNVDGNGGTDTFDFTAGPVTVNLPLGTATGEGNDTFADIESLDLTDGDDNVIWDGKTPAALINVAGRGGIDTIDASTATVAVIINLSTFTPGNDVENVLGGSGGDTLTGNVINNRLIGNAGNDTINAGLGNDFVEGNAGNDSLNPGGGADTLSYLHAPSGVVIDNQIGFASGGDDDDTLTGVFPIILGSDFDDEIIAGQTAGGVNQRIKGRKGNDIIVGSNSSDLLVGAGGNDNIRAGGGDDDLKGGAGNDFLSGSTGDDNIRGGKGPDTGIGGRGFDVCTSTKTERSCEA